MKKNSAKARELSERQGMLDEAVVWALHRAGRPSNTVDVVDVLIVLLRAEDAPDTTLRGMSLRRGGRRDISRSLHRLLAARRVTRKSDVGAARVIYAPVGCFKRRMRVPATLRAYLQRGGLLINAPADAVIGPEARKLKRDFMELCWKHVGHEANGLLPDQLRIPMMKKLGIEPR